VPTSADLLIRNARVYTVHPEQPWAGAVAVEGDRIDWVGPDAEGGEHSGPRTETIDAGGRLVLPGFIDSHNHARLGPDPDVLRLNDASSLEEIRDRIRHHMQAHPDLEWVEGDGWNYAGIPGGRMPTADDLEGVAGDRPTFLSSYDAHTVWLNREAMRRLGLHPGRGRLPWGRPALDERTGAPTGFVTDFAVLGLSRDGERALAQAVPSHRPERRERRFLSSMDMAALFGITTVVEPQNSIDDLPMFAAARDGRRFRSRLIAALYLSPEMPRSEIEAFEEARRVYDDDRFRVSPVKLYIDDVIEPHTAAMLEPYANLDTRGETFWDPAEFGALLEDLDRRAFQTFTHAIGDRGIRTALDAIGHAVEANGRRDARHQLVHVECLHPEDIGRFRELGVVACMQPRHCSPDIVEGDWMENVGPARWLHAWAFRSLRDSGATLAFSSDWTVAEMDPLVGIYTALTRASLDGTRSWVPEQTVDLATAIHAYTMGGAFANFAETNRGSLQAGKYADLIVLSGNLFEMTDDPGAILDQAVELTMVGGEIVHRAGAV
jgi:predicted amidohydrolase YtcJ